MRREKLKLFRSGGKAGVQTTCVTAEEFVSELARALTLLAQDGYFGKSESSEAMSQWLPASFEIVAKLKGYKADVEEERVIYSGASFVGEESAIAIPIPETVEA